MLKIYEFQNKHNNYLSGGFYFLEERKSDAIKVADLWARRHNKQVNSNSNYIIDFDHNTIQVHELKRGYLPLGRSE